MASTNSQTALSFMLINSATPSRTRQNSPAKRTTTVTQAQKQALIDNLQLEIADRVRKLRAQYALQAQGLRTRLEIRVHRIPAALRKTTIAELLERYTEKSAVKDAKTGVDRKQSANPAPSRLARLSPVKMVEALTKDPASMVIASPSRSVKRSSTDFEADAGKENASVFKNPKKRARTTAPPSQPDQFQPAGCTRFVATEVLSPRSNNTRALAQPPFKAMNSPFKSNFSRPASPYKPSVPRPASPLKPSITLPTAASLAKATMTVKSKAMAPVGRPASRQGATSAALRTGRAALAQVSASVPEQENDGRSSSMSDSSAGTMIVKVTKAAKGKRAFAVTTVEKEKKGGLVGKIAGKGKRVAAAVSKVEKEAVAATVGAGRVLRKRG